MEEILASEMAQVRLESIFDAEQWEAIRKRPPKPFHASQRRALQAMIKDPHLHALYFSRFQQNHTTLASWHAAATRLKPQLQKYVFKLLTNKKIRFENEKLKHAVHNPHALYLSTFYACNGWKYIYYNYEKHMKGASQRTNHNHNIRWHENKQPTDSKQLLMDSLPHPLRKYEESDTPLERTAMLTFSKVLFDRKVNSKGGLQKIVGRKDVEKIVFVNHIGKPIKYVLKQQNQ